MSITSMNECIRQINDAGTFAISIRESCGHENRPDSLIHDISEEFINNLQIEWNYNTNDKLFEDDWYRLYYNDDISISRLTQIICVDCPVCGCHHSEYDPCGTNCGTDSDSESDS